MKMQQNRGWGTGEDNNNAAMTNAEVRAARMLRYYGMAGREIARHYKVSPSTMSLILRGLIYKEAGGPVTPTDVRYRRSKICPTPQS